MEFWNYIKLNLSQRNTIDDVYINLPQMFGGQYAKIINFDVVREHHDTILMLESVGMWAYFALHFKDTISSILKGGN